MTIKTIIVIALLFFASIILYFKGKRQKSVSNQNGVTRMNSAALLSSVNACSQKNIIFDLTGVLFYPSKKFVISEIGWINMGLYALRHLKNPFSIFDKLIAFLELMSPPTSQVYRYGDKVLPEIICQWLVGRISSKEILSEIERVLKQPDHQAFFASAFEKELIAKAARVIFIPGILVQKSFVPIHEGIALVHAYNKKVDSHGNKLHKIYLLSNMDKETVPLLAQKYPEVFSCFDGMVLSADAGVMKPDKGMYDYLLSKYNLKPEECMFIDDQAENILGAQSCGISGVQFTL